MNILYIILYVLGYPWLANSLTKSFKMKSYRKLKGKFKVVKENVYRQYW